MNIFERGRYIDMDNPKTILLCYTKITRVHTHTHTHTRRGVLSVTVIVVRKWNW